MSVDIDNATGSSPRMRGTRLCKAGVVLDAGIIPAYAGNTFQTVIYRRDRRDHPRVCGEHRDELMRSRANVGSSPRMRGTRGILSRGSSTHGIIPAYAGNTAVMWSISHAMWDHPRVCGEHQVRDTLYGTTQGSSPRMRGTRHDAQFPVIETGIIPAYAGNTLRD